MALYKRFSVLTRYVVTSCALIVTLGMSGCSTKPEPALSSPTVTPSSPTSEASNSTSPPATQLEQPQPTAGMSNNDAQGAQEAADYFGKMITHIMATQQTDLLDTFAVKDCPDCNATRKAIHKLKDKQHKYQNFEVKYVLDGKPEKTGENIWYAQGHLNLSSYEILDSGNQFVEQFEATKTEGRFIVEYSKDGWKLLGMFSNLA